MKKMELLMRRLREKKKTERGGSSKKRFHISVMLLSRAISVKADRKRMSNDGLKQTFLDSSLRWDSTPRFAFTPVLINTYG